MAVLSVTPGFVRRTARRCFSMINRAPKSVFFVLCALSLLAAWRPLRDALGLATHAEEYTHLLLILPVTAAFVWLEWRPLGSSSSPGLRAGLILLALSILVAGLTRWGLERPDERLAGNMLALVTWGVGSFVLCFGTRVSR